MPLIDSDVLINCIDMYADRTGSDVFTKYHIIDFIKSAEVPEQKSDKPNYDMAKFIACNWHHCPFPENCGIDWETQCAGWGSNHCAKCILFNADKL